MPYDRWFLKYLIFTLLCLTVWICPSNANTLKDVRVGEYENFTRIVFELDADTDAVLNVIPDANELRIEFPDTQPDLIRKIPVERADLIKEIQIWKSAHQLSAVVKISAKKTRVESFSLKKPSRFAVDIFWQLPAEQDQKAVDTIKTPAGDHSAQAPTESAGAASTTTAHERHVPVATIAERTITPTVTATPNVRAPLSRGKPPAALVPRTDQAPPQPPNATAGGKTPQKRNWLQYYLVVALIVLTITILVLLVLMLLTHYRWADNRGIASSNEVLKKQKSRIAELDERIKEQLKRYDEA